MSTQFEPSDQAPRPGNLDQTPSEEPPSDWWARPIPPLIEQGNNAFRRDLPELLKTQKGQWVAYRGEDRLGFARTQTALYKECFHRGLKDDEFVVHLIDLGALDDDFDYFPGEEDEESDWAIRTLPLLERGDDAFRRDLPELLKTHYRKWVAYRGDERLGFARTQMALYRECARRGFKTDEIIVRWIEPENGG